MGFTRQHQVVVLVVTVIFLLVNMGGWIAVSRKTQCHNITFPPASDYMPMAAFQIESPGKVPVMTSMVLTSAPLLKDVKEQKNAGEELIKMLSGSVQHQCKGMGEVTNTKKGDSIKRKFCEDSELALKLPCLVYSFGINYDFGFDDFFGKRGCEVHSFDPSMKDSTHRRSPQVMFHQIGIGAEDTDTFQPRLNSYVKEKTTWKMRTLKTLVTMLNHTGRTIDVLKMDIECTEWDVARNMLESGIISQVKQFLVEWHIFPDCPPREKFQQLIAILQDLDRAGFKNFAKIPVVGPVRAWEKFREQAELAYVNTRFMNST